MVRLVFEPSDKTGWKFTHKKNIVHTVNKNERDTWEKNIYQLREVDCTRKDYITWEELELEGTKEIGTDKSKRGKKEQRERRRKKG